MTRSCCFALMICMLLWTFNIFVWIMLLICSDCFIMWDAGIWLGHLMFKLILQVHECFSSEDIVYSVLLLSSFFLLKSFWTSLFLHTLSLEVHIFLTLRWNLTLFIELCNAQPESGADAVQKQATRTIGNVVLKGNLSNLVYFYLILFSFQLSCLGMFYIQYQPIYSLLLFKGQV